MEAIKKLQLFRKSLALFRCQANRRFFVVSFLSHSYWAELKKKSASIIELITKIKIFFKNRTNQTKKKRLKYYSIFWFSTLYFS